MDEIKAEPPTDLEYGIVISGTRKGEYRVRLFDGDVVRLLGSRRMPFEAENIVKFTSICRGFKGKHVAMQGTYSLVTGQELEQVRNLYLQNLEDRVK